MNIDRCLRLGLLARVSTGEVTASRSDSSVRIVSTTTNTLAFINVKEFIVSFNFKKASAQKVEEGFTETPAEGGSAELGRIQHTSTRTTTAINSSNVPNARIVMSCLAFTLRQLQHVVSFFTKVLATAVRRKQQRQRFRYLSNRNATMSHPPHPRSQHPNKGQGRRGRATQDNGMFRDDSARLSDVSHTAACCDETL